MEYGRRRVKRLCRLCRYNRGCVCRCAEIGGGKEGGEDVVDRKGVCLLEKWIRTVTARMKRLEDEYGVSLYRWREVREERGLGKQLRERKAICC